MAMARAALRSGRPSSSFSFPFRRFLGSEATVLLLPAPRDITECADAVPLISQQEQSVEVEPCERGFSKVKANDLRRFLEEQREIFIELQNQFKDQRMLLRLICEELRCCKFELEIRKELVVVNATRVSCQTNAESCEIKAEKVQCAKTAVCERISEDGEPVVLSEKSSKNDASISKKGLDADKFQHPPWPEWELFLDCLIPYASVKDGKPHDGSGELFDDTVLLKQVLVKFAQTHEAAFRTLPRKDLVLLVQHEFPSMDGKTAVGKKKLQNYLEMDASEVSRAKLTDVVRLIYRAVRSVPLLGGALPNDLKSAIVHLLQELISASITKHDTSSATMEGKDEMIAKGGEMERLNNMTNMVDGEVLPTTSPSINQDESSSLTIASLELQKFGSLKERVDARRERLARERMEKEAAKSLLPEPLLTKELEQKALKACYTQMDKSKDNREVVRNFRAFDAIIESEDSDSCERSNSKPKASLSSLVPTNGSTLFLQNKGAQHHSGRQRSNGWGKATGRF